MREIARVAQGYFKTQPRIVEAIANLFEVPSTGMFTVLDPGCGCATAINALRSAWNARAPQTDIKLYGIESDKGRAESAQRLVGKNGDVLWSAIEDASISAPASVLFFNPPYDRIRQGGRLELLLYQKVREWAARSSHIVLIVPDYILADMKHGLAGAVERDYKLVALYRYPEPEYSEFKQCVLIGTRRDRALNRNKVDFPVWARTPSQWPILPLAGKRVARLEPASEAIELSRSNLSKELILECLTKSPLRSSLLREAMAPAPRVERPLLPLRDGHLALALAGGLCDGIITDEDTGLHFLIKGSLESKVCKVAVKKLFNFKGEHDRNKEVHRTRYCMNVRCLRTDGSIEDYSSEKPEETIPVEVVAEEGSDDHAE